MDGGQPSRTAIGAALLRAAHLVCDGEPKIFLDPWAAALSGTYEVGAIQTALAAMEAEAAAVVGPAHAAFVVGAVRTAVLVRSHYTEEAVMAAVARGLTQYVILGAGLDSFAYRRREALGRLRVFEVDHPSTQAWKRARLQALGITLPPQLTFLPLDMERQSLMTVLEAGEYHREEPAVFSCLGVSQYVPVAAVQTLLEQVALAAPGSLVLCGYLVPETRLTPPHQLVLTFLRQLTAARAEPILTVFTPEDMAARLTALGFVDVHDYGADHGFGQYTAARTDGLRYPQTHRLVHARVGAASAR